MGAVIILGFGTVVQNISSNIFNGNLASCNLKIFKLLLIYMMSIEYGGCFAITGFVYIYELSYN